MSEQKTIRLAKPITVGETEYAEITVFEPNVMALKGLSLHALQFGHSDQLVELLPKITEPRLTQKIIKQMSVKDLSKFALVVTAFLTDPTEWSEEEAQTQA